VNKYVLGAAMVVSCFALGAVTACAAVKQNPVVEAAPATREVVFLNEDDGRHVFVCIDTEGRFLCMTMAGFVAWYRKNHTPVGEDLDPTVGTGVEL
jgi:hypothetical protein